MKDRIQSRRRLVFMMCAAIVLAHMVAGKAVRDGLFLSRFSPADLPKVVGCAALIAVLMGIGFTRVLARRGPLTLVPAAFAAGAMLHLLEYILLESGGDAVRGAVVTVVYLHLVGFGPILLSGFWSVAGEVFDPREAKREFGRITGAGTAGGILGGLLAERGAAWFGGDSLLILLAALHFCAALILLKTTAAIGSSGEPDADEPWHAAREAFRQSPFLLNLSALVLIGTVSAGLLDYLFKSSAAAAYGRGPQLTRYFALFYTANQVLTFTVQTWLTPLALRRLGLGRTMRWHPAAVGFGAGLSLFSPSFLIAQLARSLELIFRGSFLRSSYELFFTPVPPREKRATKVFIDVSCDRLGDALGAGLLQLLLVLSPGLAVKSIAALAGGLAAAGFWLARRMDAAYSGVVERGLVDRAVALHGAGIHESTGMATLLHTSVSFAPRAEMQSVASRPVTHDPVLARMADLRSGAPRRICAALAPDQSFEPALVPLAIRLLAWDEAFECVRAFLLRHAHRVVGQLVDELLDPEQDEAIRRRVPPILAYTTSQRAVDGLAAALEDRHFEIRRNVSRALEFLHRMNGDLQFDHTVLMAAVERELSISRSIWQGRKVLETRGSADSQYWCLDEVLLDRADKSLEHVFSLLAVQLPLEPLKAAFRALHTDDRLLRGLALEFLETHLSPRLVSLLRGLVEPVPGLALQQAASTDGASSAVAPHPGISFASGAL